MKQFTLCMVCRDGQILLGMKKKGFGEGFWNGFGGHLEKDETIEEAAQRELTEEAGIVATDMTKIGVLTFSFEEDPKLLEVHVFKAGQFTGEPTESDEMRPEWFAYDAIPYEQMWSDDKFWVPLMLEDIKFEGTFHFDRPSTLEYSAKILAQQLTVIE